MNMKHVHHYRCNRYVNHTCEISKRRQEAENENTPSGQNRQKNNLQECIFDSNICILSAELTKTALLQTVLWRFCQLGSKKLLISFYVEVFEKL